MKYRAHVSECLALILVASCDCSASVGSPDSSRCASGHALLQHIHNRIPAVRARPVRARRHGDQLPHILHVGGRSLSDRSYRDSWERNNPEWQVDALTDDRIMSLATTLSAETKKLLESEMHSVKFSVEKSDIARLLALQQEGGVYVDGDVKDKVPIDQWAAHYQYQEKDLDLILGVEFPRKDDFDKNPPQIANFALAASPGNAILSYAVDKIIKDAHNIPDTKANIKRRTGPIALTSAIIEALQQHFGMAFPNLSQVSSEFDAWKGHLYNLEEEGKPDMKVLILPYRSFCYHPTHGKEMAVKDHGTWRRTKTVPGRTAELQLPSSGNAGQASELTSFGSGRRGNAGQASELTSFGSGNAGQASELTSSELPSSGNAGQASELLGSGSNGQLQHWLGSAQGAAQVVLQTYPGYAGTSSVQGEAILSVDAGVLSLKWDLTGTDDACGRSGPDPNANLLATNEEPSPKICGLRVHAGKSCANSSDVGGVLGWNISWAKAGNEDNPWIKTTYVSLGSASKGARLGPRLTQLDEGLPAILGKPFVVYDSSGARAACGITVLGSPDPTPPPQTEDPTPPPETKPPQSGESGASRHLSGFWVVSIFCCMLTLTISRST